MKIDFADVWQPVQLMLHSFLERVPYIVVALIVFGGFWAVGVSVRSVTQRAVAGRQRARSLGLVLGRVAQGLIVFLGMMVALVIVVPTFQPGDLAQILGIGSVAFGFAFRDILQNFLAGILLLLSEPFRIGDQIVVGAYEGTVEDIQTRATFLRTYDGRRIVIPNSNLFTQSVTVNTAFERRRLEYEVRVSADNDIAHASQVLLDAVSAAQTNLEDAAPDVLVVNLDGGVTLRARWWVRPASQKDRLAARSQVLTSIQNALRDQEIIMPVATQQVVLRQDDSQSPSQPEA